jgi:hypothetical protein
MSSSSSDMYLLCRDIFADLLLGKEELFLIMQQGNQ